MERSRIIQLEDFFEIVYGRRNTKKNQLMKSPSAPAVKARAKQMLMGEGYIDVKDYRLGIFNYLTKGGIFVYIIVISILYRIQGQSRE